MTQHSEEMKDKCISLDSESNTTKCSDIKKKRNILVYINIYI